MKALVLVEYNKFTLEDVPVPGYDKDEVLIRVGACSICGSDVHGMDGSTGRRIPPVIMGHEAAGTIEKVGEDVKGFKPGDRVAFDSMINCGKCSYCRQGEINLCDDRRIIGVSCKEFKYNGAFAEYVVVPEHILYKLPDNLTFERAAVAEPLSVAYHALNCTPEVFNSNVVVVGAGMVGLLLIQLLKLNNCRHVIAVDLVQEKLEMAKKFGADIVLRSDLVDVPEEVRKLTGNQGADVAFEVVGITPTVQCAIECLKKGGAATLVGNLNPKVDFPLQSVVTRNLSVFGSCASSGEYKGSLELIASGKIDVDTFISKVAPLSEGAVWFDKLYKGEDGLMKVILKP